MKKKLIQIKELLGAIGVFCLDLLAGVVYNNR